MNEKKMVPLSISEKPDVEAPSSFAGGRKITHAEWCRCEAERLRSLGVAAEVRTDIDGTVAVWVPQFAKGGPR